MPITAPRSLSVIILTKNEEANLPFALASLSQLDADIFVVDSGSVDRTVEIAGASGAMVFFNEWINYAHQFNWALDTLPIQTPWTMRLDADETLTSDLVRELKLFFINPPNKTSGLLMKRRVYFWGRWIRYGGYYPTWLLRVWRTGKGRCEETWMDEHILLSNGEIQRLKGDLIDENHKGLSFWIEKHNSYSDREVRSILTQEPLVSGKRAGTQAAWRRLMKRAVYANSPRFFRAFLYWFYRYFLLLGFLDGRAGLVFHFLQAFWYRLLVDAKLMELEIGHPDDTSRH